MLQERKDTVNAMLGFVSRVTSDWAEWQFSDLRGVTQRLL